MSNFCEDLGNYWSRTGQRQRCIVYLYCVSELETNSDWIFGTQPEAICFQNTMVLGTDLAFRLPFIIVVYGGAPTSRDLIHQDDLFQISPGGSPWPPNLHDLQASWGYWGERGAPTLPQQVPSRWNFYPNHTIDGSEIANNWYIYPSSSFLYKMGWVVRKIKWIYYKMGCTTPPGQLEGWCIFTISTDARFLASTVGSGILHMDHLWSFSKTSRFVWSNRLPGIQIPVVFYFAFSDVI